MKEAQSIVNHCVMSSDWEQSTLSDFVISSDCEQPALSDIVISSDCVEIVSRHDNHAAATSIPSGVPAQFCFLLAASSESR